jgi:nicotinamidase-related amidase
MTRVALVCQGFQRGFVDTTGRMLSVSASVRRSLCERILNHARSQGWPVIHIYLDAEGFSRGEANSLDGFAPGPNEPYFRQKSISAFSCQGLEAKLRSYGVDTVFLTSFAGLAVIAATLLDALQLHIPLHLVTDAIADVTTLNATEDERLTAAETLARACGRNIASSDLFGVGDSSGSWPTQQHSRLIALQ